MPLFVKDERRAENIETDFATLQFGDKHDINKKIGKRRIKSGFSNIPSVPEIKGKKRLWDCLTVCPLLALQCGSILKYHQAMCNSDALKKPKSSRHTSQHSQIESSYFAIANNWNIGI